MLTVEHLTVTFDSVDVIKNLSFKVKEGEVLVILGPNGAGKTTLLRALLGLIPYTGKILWASEDISYLPPQELLERRGLPPLNIEEFFRFKDVSTDQILKIFEEVGLDPSLLKRGYGTLSTGQFQRMIIAWALVDEPSVLLFDEPTSGVDIGGQETIYSLLHRFWKERNLTILLVTHDLNVVWEHAETVLCMNKEKLCYGPPRTVLTPDELEKIYGSGIKYYEHTHR
jgi:ABC-type Mn2+/Zn2+ transport system ATPase subunit